MKNEKIAKMDGTIEILGGKTAVDGVVDEVPDDGHGVPEPPDAVWVKVLS